MCYTRILIDSPMKYIYIYIYIQYTSRAASAASILYFAISLRQTEEGALSLLVKCVKQLGL